MKRERLQEGFYELRSTYFAGCYLSEGVGGHFYLGDSAKGE